MGVRIIEDRHSGAAVLYCSSSMWAFGPVFENEDEALRFLRWLLVDPRGPEFTDSVLERKVTEFRMQDKGETV